MFHQKTLKNISLKFNLFLEVSRFVFEFCCCSEISATVCRPACVDAVASVSETCAVQRIGWWLTSNVTDVRERYRNVLVREHQQRPANSEVWIWLWPPTGCSYWPMSCLGVYLANLFYKSWNENWPSCLSFTSTQVLGVRSMGEIHNLKCDKKRYSFWTVYLDDM